MTNNVHVYIIIIKIKKMSVTLVLGWLWGFTIGYTMIFFEYLFAAQMGWVAQDVEEKKSEQLLFFVDRTKDRNSEQIDRLNKIIETRVVE